MTHAPTSTGAPHHVPTTCFCCGRRATGIGFGDFKTDPHWLCQQCIPLLEQIRSARRFDVYENSAIDMTIEAVGPSIEANGADLSEWTESQVRQFIVDVIMHFGDAIRTQVRTHEVPF
jgi:hypothetical protein